MGHDHGGAISGDGLFDYVIPYRVVYHRLEYSEGVLRSAVTDVRPRQDLGVHSDRCFDCPSADNLPIGAVRRIPHCRHGLETDSIIRGRDALCGMECSVICPDRTPQDEIHALETGGVYRTKTGFRADVVEGPGPVEIHGRNAHGSGRSGRSNRTRTSTSTTSSGYNGHCANDADGSDGIHLPDRIDRTSSCSDDSSRACRPARSGLRHARTLQRRQAPITRVTRSMSFATRQGFAPSGRPYMTSKILRPLSFLIAR